MKYLHINFLLIIFFNSKTHSLHFSSESIRACLLKRSTWSARATCAIAVTTAIKACRIRTAWTTRSARAAAAGSFWARITTATSSGAARIARATRATWATTSTRTATGTATTSTWNAVSSSARIRHIGLLLLNFLQIGFEF